MKKRIWKKRIALVICIVMTLTSLPTASFALEARTQEGMSGAEKADAVFQVSWSDRENKAQRRDAEKTKLFSVYADGELLEDQPQISLKSLAAKTAFGVQTYTYQIKGLPIYKSGSQSQIQYTIKEAVPKGYTAFTEKALKGASVEEARQYQEKLAGPEEELALELEQDGQWSADKAFGNYLPEYAVSGSITWKEQEGQASARPEIKEYFGSHFSVTKDEKPYTADVAYEQDKTDKNKWNYTAEGLFSTKEDGSKASYTLDAGIVEGYGASAREFAVEQDLTNADFVWTQKKEGEPKREKAAAPKQPKTKPLDRSAGDKAVEAAQKNGSAQVSAVWMEKTFQSDHSSTPPTIALEYTIAGGKTSRIACTYDTTEKKWKPNPTDAQKKELGSDLADCEIAASSGGVGIDTIRASKLPSQITNADAETKAIIWKMEITDPPSGYYLETPAAGTTYKLIEQTEYTADIVLRDGGKTSAGAEDALALETIKENLLVVVDGAEYTVAGLEQQLAKDYGKAELDVRLIRNGTGYKLNITGIPWCDTNKKEFVYSVKYPEPANKDEDYYAPAYDNAKAPNFGTVNDQCHNGGSLILTLTGKTSYSGTKVWLDDKSEKTKAERPQTEWYLWRYSGVNGSYTSASQVKEGTAIIFRELDEKKDTETVTINPANPLPKYDTDGYPYVYFIRETMDGGNYEEVFGKVNTAGEIVEDTLPAGMAQRETANKSLYNGGTLSNRITGTTTITQKKTWKAAAHQGDLEDVRVELTLKSQKKGSSSPAWETVKDKDGKAVTAELTGFIAEILTKEASAAQPAYDQQGMPLEYKWEETAVYEGAGSTENLLENKKFTLSHNTDSSKDGAEWYESAVDKDGTIINQLKGTTSYYVDKRWAQLNDDGTVQTDGQGNTVYGKDAPDGAEITIDLRQDNESYEGVTLDGSETEPWAYQWEGLEKYDDGGKKYSYVAEESAGYDGWQSDYTYDLDELKTKSPNNCRIDNAPVGVGKLIKVKKEWLDDGDVPHRQKVEVEVWRKADDRYGETADVSFGTVTLEEGKNWWSYVGVTEYVVEDEGGNQTITKTKPQGATEEDLYKDGDYYIREVKMGDTDVYDDETRTKKVSEILGSKVPGTAEKDYVSTADHKYEASYGQETGACTVYNRRVGKINLTVEKEWVDKGVSKDERKNLGAKATLTCQEYPDAVAENGTVTIEEETTQIQDKIGNPVGATQALTGSSDTERLYFWNLPKYDAKGKVIHYGVEETKTPELEDADYKVTVQQTGYEAGKLNAADSQGMKITNKRSGSKALLFHKRWIDKNNYQSGKRPDIYLTLYKTDSQNTTPVLMKEYLDRKWQPQGSDNAYNWTCNFGELPKYDDAGQEIIYYASEGMHVDRTALDYIGEQYEFAGKTYSKVGWNPLTKQYTVTHDADTEDTKNVLNANGKAVLKEGGTFVNEVRKNLTIEGKKVWKNVPDDFPADELPVLNFQVYRDYQEGGANTPAATIDNVASSGLQFTFSFNYEGKNQQNGTPGEGQTYEKFLPKYDAEGALYDYSVQETVSDQSNPDLNTAYEELPGAVHNYIITNSYNNGSSNKNKGSLKINKTWTIDTDKFPQGKYPQLTFELYRFFEYKNDPGVYSAAQKIQAKSLDNGGAELTFTDLPIYAPNSKPYHYFVREKNINGYHTPVVSGGTPPISGMPETALTGWTSSGVQALMPDRPVEVNFGNEYSDPQASIELDGKKIWQDHDGEYFDRPAAIELTLSRWADSQGGNNAISEEKMFTVTGDDPDITMMPGVTNTNQVGLAWDNAWWYAISGLDRYAPNGSPWQYKVKETVPAQYAAICGEVTAAAVNANSGKVTMRELTNSSGKTASLIKSWEGNNDHSLRPASIEVKLQAKVGANGAWQDAAEALKIDGSYPPGVGEAADYFVKTVAVDNSNPGDVSFDKLPAYKGSEAYYYRIIETKIGNETVTSQDGAVDTVTYSEAGMYQPEQTALELEAGPNRTDTTTIDNTIAKDNVTTLKVEKKWSDSENAYNTRPENIYLKLQQKTGADSNWSDVPQADGQTPVTKTLSAKDGWEAAYSELPKNNKDGSPYLYRAVEIKSLTETDIITKNGAYKTDCAAAAEEDGTHVAAITNTLTPTLTVEARKVWHGEQKEVTLELQYKDKGSWTSFTARAEISLDGTRDGNGEAEAWTAQWTGLPAHMTDGTTERTYRVIETTGLTNDYSVTYSHPDGIEASVAGETASDLEFTVTNTQKTSFTVNKVWEDMDFIRAADAPKSVSFKLWKKVQGTTGYPAEEGNQVKDGAGKQQIIIINKPAAGQWAGTASGLPKYDSSGNLYIYYATETDITFEGASQEGSADKPFTAAASHTEGKTTYTNTLETTSAKVTKKWQGDAKYPELRPQELTLQLYCGTDLVTGNELPTPSIVKNENHGTWDYTWSGLPKYDKLGTAYVYTVKEDQLSSYEQPQYSGVGSAANGGTITNKLTELALQKQAFEGDALDANFGSGGKEIKPGSPIELLIYHESNQNQPAAKWSMDENGAVSSAVQSGSQWVDMKGDDKGKILGLPVGNYVVKETKTPLGYLTAAASAFELKGDGTIDGSSGSIIDQKLTIADKRIRGDVKLTKYLDNINNPLPNTAFDLYLEKGNLKIAEGLATGADGSLTVKGQPQLFIGGPDDGKPLALGLRTGDYYFLESGVPGGSAFDKITKRKFSISGDSANSNPETVEVQVINKEVKVRIAKVSVEDQKPLIGAAFKVIPESGSSFASGVSEIIVDTNDSEALYGELIVGNTYRIRETKIPAGYQRMIDVTFRVTATGGVEAISGAHVTADERDGVVTLTAKNELIRASFLKRLQADNTAAGLAGAEVTITGEFADGTKSHTFTTGAKAEALDKLIAGKTYTLKETQAPAGAMMQKDGYTCTFTVDEWGNINSDSGMLSWDKPKEILSLANQPTVLKLFKKGADTESSSKDPLLADCKFSVRGKFAADRYGYSKGALAKAGKHTLTVTTTGSDGTDNALKGRLLMGESYVVKEIAPPSGYELGTEVSFTVTGAKQASDGTMKLQIELLPGHQDQGYVISYDKDGNPIITQRDNPVEMQIKKTDMRETPLAGAKFAITGIFGNGEKESTKEFAANSEGLIDLSKVLNESSRTSEKEYIYRLEETKAPSQHKQLQKPIYFKLDSREGESGQWVSRLAVLYGAGRTPDSYSQYITAGTEGSIKVLTIKNEKILPAASDEKDALGGISIKTDDDSSNEKDALGGAGTKTGDDSNMVIYIVLLILAAAVIAGIFIRRKK